LLFGPGVPDERTGNRKTPEGQKDQQITEGLRGSDNPLDNRNRRRLKTFNNYRMIWRLYVCDWLRERLKSEPGNKNV
jgi:hypothetical protein